MVAEHVVRFSEVDAAGILFFSRVFEIAHHAYEDWLAARGLPIGERMARGDWVLPLVHAEADYRAPLRLGDRVRIEVSVERVGGASLTMRFELSGPDGAPAATVRHVHAAIDRATFRPRPLPAELRAALEPDPPDRV